MEIVVLLTIITGAISAFLGVKIADYIAKPYLYESEKKTKLENTTN